jgi:predicted AlkP superfamily pyrophosphatase or phosphodiesterase
VNLDVTFRRVDLSAKARVKTLKFILFFAVCFAFSSNGAFDRNRIVVLVSLDGLANFYWQDPKAEMPYLRALAEQGARAKSMVPVIPTVTWPNHTTLVTGTTPRLHGVIGNNFFERQTKRVVTLIQDPVLDKDEIVRVPTIYDAAKLAGLQTAAVHWPATRNAKNLDWQVPATRSMANQRQFITPSLLKECEENGIPIVDETIKERQPSEQSDDLSVRVLNMVIKKHRPQLALLHIGYTDHAQHAHGPRSPQAYAAIKSVDAELGKVWSELQTDFPEKATLFVVSDHGFSRIDHYIPMYSLVQKLHLDVTKDQSKPIELLTQGGTLFVYITDQGRHDEIEKKLVKAYGKEEGVTRVLKPSQFKANGLATSAEDPHAPDLIVVAGKGYYFGDTSAGQIPKSEKPEVHGSHGQDPREPDLHAMFVAWGVGIKRGTKIGEINNTDVAPTIAKILQVDLPTAEGKPLNKILSE